MIDKKMADSERKQDGGEAFEEALRHWAEVKEKCISFIGREEEMDVSGASTSNLQTTK